MKILLDKGADVSTTGSILLFSEIGYMDQKIVAHSRSSSDDIFPLFISCIFFTDVPVTIKEKIIRALLSAGADANQRTAIGQTALHGLCASHSSTISPYREFSLDDDDYCDDHFGETLLIKAFIDHGADVNICDDLGKSPLHYAVRMGDGYCAKFLLKRGANVYLKDIRGLTALEYASTRDYKLTLALIDKYNFPMEKVIQAYECAAIIAASNTAETLRKATLLRQEHGIPKTVLPPVECYGYQKEWETLEELDKCGNDEFQLSLSCLLAMERISKDNRINFVRDFFLKCK